MTTQTPPPYVPQQPATPVQTIHAGASGFSITSLILGIISLLGFGFLAGIPAIIFGGIALKRKRPGHGLSLTGVITGSIGTILSLLFVAFMVIVVTIGSNLNYQTESTPYYERYSEPIENPRT